MTRKYSNDLEEAVFFLRHYSGGISKLGNKLEKPAMPADALQKLEKHFLSMENPMPADATSFEEERLRIIEVERNHRFLEEALELVQSGGCTASEAHQLVDYVYSRPVGEMAQEVGGVLNTLAALCLAYSIDMDAAGETELARVWTKVETIRAKQAAKPKHGPLPGPVSPGQPAPATTPLPPSKAALDVMREALRPFAEEACRYDPPEGDDGDHLWYVKLTIGHVRRAAAALAELDRLDRAEGRGNG